MNNTQSEPTPPFEASFSVLLTSIASSAAISMGLAPNPQTQETHKDRSMARFNIDLLSILKEKTKGNLSPDEARLLDALLADLQLKFVQMRD
jgi:hypothetical protein